MEEDYGELSTYLLIKRYRAIKDKDSAEAKELENLIRDDLNLSAEMDFGSEYGRKQISDFVRTSKSKIEKFINITAWIFIILTGLKFTGSGCGLIGSDFNAKLSEFVSSRVFSHINPYMQFLLQHYLLITVVNTLFFLFAFFVCIGVLYRSNLARKLAIVILIIKIIENFIQPVLVKYVYPSAYDFRYKLPKSVVDGMYQSSLVMSVLLSVVFISLYGWLIYKYTSPEIKEEFE